MPQQTFTDVQPIQASAPAQSFTDVQPIDAAPTPPKRTWLDSAQDFAGELWKQVNPVSGIKGAAQLAAHPIDTYKQDVAGREQIMQKAEEAFKKGDYGSGVSHALYAVIPFLGQSLNEAGENLQQGNFAKGAGATVGMAANLAGPEAIKGMKLGVPDAIPERMYQAALKPSTTLPTGTVKNIVRTGLDEAIPVSEGGAKKLNVLVDDLNKKIQAKIDAGSNRGATVDPTAVAGKADALKGKFATQVNPEADLNAIASAKDEFLRNNPNPIPASDAQALKVGTYRQLRGKYGELGSAVEESQKALALGIKEELETSFPEIKGMNARESQFLGLLPSLERAVKRINSREIFSLGGKISGGAGLAAGIATGHEGLGAVAGVAMHYALTDPIVQSKLAIALSKSGNTTISAARARVAGYVNELGNAANAQSPGDQTTGQ